MSKNNEKQSTGLPKVFTFKESNQPIRVEVINGEPWFLARDVCDVLGHTNPRVMVQMLDDDERCKQSLRREDHVFGNDEAWFVSESGLYTLIIRSNRPNAKVFRKWVTSEVLPSIRKTGGYVAVDGNYLDRAIAIAGSRVNLARRIGLSQSVITDLYSRPEHLSVALRNYVFECCRLIVMAADLNVCLPAKPAGLRKGSKRIDREGIWADLCRIDDNALRRSLACKLQEGGAL